MKGLFNIPGIIEIELGRYRYGKQGLLHKSEPTVAVARPLFDICTGTGARALADPPSKDEEDGGNSSIRLKGFAGLWKLFLSSLLQAV